MTVQGSSYIISWRPFTTYGLRLYSKLLFWSVVALIFMGALVKSHEAGLAVPDWPTSYGENMFLFSPSKWVGGIFYEHVHRLVASAVGALTLVFMVWCLLAESRRWVRVLSVVALLAVIVQGLLGGLTVIYRLPDAISVAHGILAQTFLLITLVLAYAYSKEYTEKSESALSSQLFKASLVFIGLIYLQLTLGALTRHAEAGLALLDFPTTGGSVIPMINESLVAPANEARKALSMAPVTLYQITLHVLHRIGGVLLLLSACVLPLLSYKCGNVKLVRHSWSILLLVLLQFALGASVILTHRMPYLTSVHVMMGAILLALTGLLALRAGSLGVNR